MTPSHRQIEPLLVRGGTVVDGGIRGGLDVLLTDGRVAAVGEDLAAPGVRQIDAGGCFVLPGGVDPHTHVLGAVASDTRSALAGGTTTALVFVDGLPGKRMAETVVRTIEQELGAAAIDIGLHGVLWEPEAYREGDVAALAAAGAPSLKLWLAYRELGIQIDDGSAYRVLHECAREGVLALAHCENGDVILARREELVAVGRRSLQEHPGSRPIALEAEAVHRFLALAEIAEATAYVVHVSGDRPLQQIVAARGRGQRVYAECCSHHLLFDEDVYATADACRFLMTPPLRSPADRDALWQGLAEGAIDTYASDHSHLTLASKLAAGNDFTRAEYGLPGIGARLSIALGFGYTQGRLGIERAVEACCAAPARIFGLAPRKGTLRPGADADVVVYDPAVRATLGLAGLQDGLDYSPYEGLELQGSIRHVIAGGEHAVRDGVLVGRARPGMFLPRPPLARCA